VECARKLPPRYEHEGLGFHHPSQRLLFGKAPQLAPPLDPEVAEATLVSSSNPTDGLELLALRNALAKLPVDQKEALILVGAGGMSYEEAAEVCACAVGTIKSRVSRARKAVIEILETNDTGYNSDPNMSAGQAFDDIMKQADEIAGAPTV